MYDKKLQCPVCEKTIQMAYSDYCIGCMQELRTIRSAAAATQMSKGVRC